MQHAACNRTPSKNIPYNKIIIVLYRPVTMLGPCAAAPPPLPLSNAPPPPSKLRQRAATPPPHFLTAAMRRSSAKNQRNPRPAVTLTARSVLAPILLCQKRPRRRRWIPGLGRAAAVRPSAQGSTCTISVSIYRKIVNSIAIRYFHLN